MTALLFDPSSDEEIDPEVQAGFDLGDFASIPINDFFSNLDAELISQREYSESVNEFEAHCPRGMHDLLFELVCINENWGCIVGIFAGRDLTKEIMKLCLGTVPTEDTYYFRPCPSGIAYSVYDPDYILSDTGCPHRGEYSIFYTLDSIVSAISDNPLQNIRIITDSYGQDRLMFTDE